jgi:hypothetical protein
MFPDITAQKVAVPAALFLALSPGVLVTTAGKNVKFANGQTNQMAIFFHALVFFLVYSLIAKAMGLLALSPGLLLTLPPGSGGVFRSGQTSLPAVVTHAVVFAVVFAVLRRQFPQFY